MTVRLGIWLQTSAAILAIATLAGVLTRSRHQVPRSLVAARLMAAHFRGGDVVCRFGGEIGPVTISIGLAAAPEHGKDGHMLIQIADAALHRAKQARRDRVMVADLVGGSPAVPS